MRADSGNDLFYFFPDFYLGAEKLFGLRNRFAFDDFANRELHLFEIFKGDLRLFRQLHHVLFFFFLSLLRQRLTRLKHRCCLFQNFLYIQSCEQDFRLLCNFAAGYIATESRAFFEAAQGSIELGCDLFRSARHIRLQQGRTDYNALCQVIQYGSKTICFCRVFCQHPRLCLVDIFVAALEQRENIGDRICDSPAFHLCRNLIVGSGYNCFQILINRLCCALIRYNAAEILVAHGNRTIYQVAQRIGEIGI